MYGYEEHIDLSPDQLLQKVSQEQIFAWILKQSIDIKERYLSPFRQDSHPGCRFEVREDGTLLFIDYKEQLLSGHTHRSCFGMVRDAHPGISMQTAIKLVCEQFGLSTSSQDYTNSTLVQIEVIEKPTEIKVDRVPFSKRDMLHWSQFLIKPEELLSDNVYAISRFSLSNHKGFRVFRAYGPAYCIDFIDKKKIYQPYSTDYKWISNCDENCIGNIDNLPPTGDELVVKKSYKDHRVIRNLFPNLPVIWFMNEGSVPSMEILVNLVSRFTLITVFFDNDHAGTLAALKIVAILENIRPGCARMIHLPVWADHSLSYKDPSKLISKEGRRDSIILLNQIGLYG